jgi:hypothetical protein
VVIICSLMLSSCVGTLVGAALDTTVEVVKLPFKVAGAVIEAVIPDRDEEEEKDAQR